MQHIEERVELDLRVWRYLLPPSLETPGHEIMGSQPVWQPIKPTDHFICETGDKNTQIFLFSFLITLSRCSQKCLNPGVFWTTNKGRVKKKDH